MYRENTDIKIIGVWKSNQVFNTCKISPFKAQQCFFGIICFASHSFESDTNELLLTFSVHISKTYKSHSNTN